MLLEDFFRCQAFDRPDDFRRTRTRNTLNQKMDMILVGSNLQKTNLISFLDSQTDVFQDTINLLVQNYFAILGRTDKMIQQYANIVNLMCVFAFAHALKKHFSPQAAGNSPLSD